MPTIRWPVFRSNVPFVKSEKVVLPRQPSVLSAGRSRRKRRRRR